jgi:hypothetical protein
MTTSWSSLFLTWEAGMTDYIAQHLSNYSRIQTCLDYLYALTGQGRAILDVPNGLQQIFDRNGVIGVASYQPPSGNHGSSITVPAGAAWLNSTFYYKSTSTVISMSGMTTGTYYVNLDSGGTPSISASATNPVWQFSWNGSNTVSSVALYSGRSVLFDGDDYHNQLISSYWSTTYTSVADRLANIEYYLGKAVQAKTSATSVAIDWSLGSHARVTLDRATTTFTFSGAYDGQKCTLEIVQDAVGGRGIDFGGVNIVDGLDFSFPIPISQDAEVRDLIGFMYLGSTSKYHYVSLARGY